MKSRLKNRFFPLEGFTLIELLIVFSLIGILMAISFVAFNATRKSARDSKRKSDLEQIRSSLEMYRSDQGYYPDTGDLTFGGTLTDPGGTLVYLQSVPTDPLSPDYYYVYSRQSTNTYYLCTFLETSSGDAGCGDCGSIAGQTCNYKLINP